VNRSLKTAKERTDILRDIILTMAIESHPVSYRLSHKKALVTGASGFLGSHLCRHLCDRGAEVHAVSRNPHPAKTGTLWWWQGDMADLASTRALLEGIKPDVIFHLAGVVTAAPDRELVLPTFHSLLLSTVHILTVAAAVGCERIVLVGSLTEPMLDSSEGVPSSPYAAAKWASSTYGRMFHQLYRSPVVIVRPFMTYGPQQDIRKLIPYVTLALLRDESPQLSSGEWNADWIYVDDVIDGFIAAMTSSQAEGCTVDLGSGTLVSVRTIVQEIVKLTGAKVEPAFGALPDRPFEQVRVADVAQAAAKIGWRPATPLAVGLQRTVEWYREHLGGAKR
jgi:UDP-glucose 4-epimerase